MSRVISSTRARASGGRPASFGSSRVSSACRIAFEPLPQRDDGRDDLARLHPRREPRDLLLDDRLGRARARRRAARGSRGRSSGGRRCCRGTPGRDSPTAASTSRGTRDVDDEQRPAAPRPHHLLDARPREHRLADAGGGDHDVGDRERVVQRRPRARRGRRCRAASCSRGRERAARDRDLADVLRLQVHAGQLGHLARAEDQRRSARELAEDLLRQRDRRVADRHRALAEARFGAHALADAEGRMEQPVRERAGAMPNRSRSRRRP